jgi:hypothetical protein
MLINFLIAVKFKALRLGNRAVGPHDRRLRHDETFRGRFEPVPFNDPA